MERANCKVCVTGAAGFVGSSLVKKLLEKGYTVHGTLRNLGDLSKVEPLKSLPGADTRLVLFQADLYNPKEFEQAIQGCTFVFLVANPMIHTGDSHFKNTTEVSVSAMKSIVMSCLKSGSVRRLIYTASVFSASAMKEDGSGFKDSMDETCWTPLNLSYPYYDFFKNYVETKTITEKEILKYCSDAKACGVEIVSLACGLVGGDTVLPYTPGSLTLLLSQLTENVNFYQGLTCFEHVLGKAPVVHINDVCGAHIFCMDNPSITSGRFLCASSFVSTAEIANFYQLYYPEFHVKQEYLDGPKRDIKWGSNRLTEKGFEYRYDLKMIIDDSIMCARRTGLLQQ